MLIAWILLLITYAIAFWSYFSADKLFGNYTWWIRGRTWIVYGIPAMISLASFLCGIVSLFCRRMKVGCITVTLASFITVGVFGGVFGWNTYQELKIKELLESEFTDTHMEQLGEIYVDSVKKKKDIRVHYLEEQVREQSIQIEQGFLENEISVDDALERLNYLKMTGILETDVNEVIKNIEKADRAIRYFQKAVTYKENLDYVSAIETLSMIEVDDINYEDAQKEINVIQKEYKEIVLNEVDTLLADKNYIEAMERLNDSENILEADSDIMFKINSTKEAYVSEILQQAKDAEERRAYSEAKDIIRQGLEIVTDNKLQNKLNEYEKYSDTKMIRLPVIDSSKCELTEDNETFQDSYGNSYDDSFMFEPSSKGEKAYLYVNADGRFRYLQGTIASGTDMVASFNDGTDNVYKVIIYADDQKVYESPVMKKISQPVNVKVDINYAKVVQIQYRRGDGYYGSAYAIFGDPMLTNN